MDAWDTKIIRTKIITLFYYYERVSPRSNNILYIKVFYINITHTHTHIYISGMRSMRSRVFSGLFIFGILYV